MKFQSFSFVFGYGWVAILFTTIFINVLNFQKIIIKYKRLRVIGMFTKSCRFWWFSVDNMVFLKSRSVLLNVCENLIYRPSNDIMLYLLYVQTNNKNHDFRQTTSDSVYNIIRKYILYVVNWLFCFVFICFPRHW
jgi:hypothetical protein